MKRFILLLFVVLGMGFSTHALSANDTKESICKKEFLCPRSDDGVCSIDRVGDLVKLCEVVYVGVTGFLPKEARAAVSVVTLETSNMLGGFSWSINEKTVYVEGAKLFTSAILEEALKSKHGLEANGKTSISKVMIKVIAVTKNILIELLDTDRYAKVCVALAAKPYVPDQMRNHDTCIKVTTTAINLSYSNLQFAYGSKAWIKNPADAIFMVYGIVGATNTLATVIADNIDRLQDISEFQSSALESEVRDFAVKEAKIRWPVLIINADQDQHNIFEGHREFEIGACEKRVNDKFKGKFTFEKITGRRSEEEIQREVYTICLNIHRQWYEWARTGRFEALNHALLTGDKPRYDDILNNNFYGELKSSLTNIPEQIRRGNLTLNESGLTLDGGVGSRYVRRAVALGIADHAALTASLGISDVANSDLFYRAFVGIFNAKYRDFPAPLTKAKFVIQKAAYKKCAEPLYSDGKGASYAEFGSCLRQSIGVLTDRSSTNSPPGRYRFFLYPGFAGNGQFIDDAYLNALSGNTKGLYQPGDILSTLDVYSIAVESISRVLQIRKFANES